MHSSKSASDKRFLRKLLVLPRFQLLIIGINFGVVLIMSLIIWVGTQSALQDLQPAAGLSGIEVTFYKNYLNYQTRSFQFALLASFVIGTLVSGVLTLIITHRISGPMIRMREYFRSLSRSNRGQPIPELSFRDGDYFKDLPPLINAAIGQLRDPSEDPNKKAS